MATQHWRPAPIALGLARGPVLGAALAVTAAVSGLFGIWLSLADADLTVIVASQMAFTADRFIDALGPLGPDGVAEVVRLTATLDFVYPVAYAIALAGAWARLAGPGAWGGRGTVMAAAFGAAAADWVENLLHMAAAASLAGGSRPSGLLVAAGSLFATVKWILLVGAVLATARAALQRRGRVALAAVPLTLLAGLMAATVVAATI